MYENSIIHPKPIRRIINTNTIAEFEPGTIAVLDEFDQSNEDYFKINDNFNFYYDNKKYFVNFIIGKNLRYDDLKNIVISNITLTEFKKIYKLPLCYDLESITNCLNHDSNILNLTTIPKLSLPVFDFICTFKQNFTNHINTHCTECNYNSIIRFDFPITINGQSSKNRQYHDGSCWYGETNTYPIIGYIIIKS